MSDVVSDIEAGYALAIEAAMELQKRDPGNELITFFTEGHDDVVYEIFQQCFSRESSTKAERMTAMGQAYFWAHYLIALETALGIRP